MFLQDTVSVLKYKRHGILTNHPHGGAELSILEVIFQLTDYRNQWVVAEVVLSCVEVDGSKPFII